VKAVSDSATNTALLVQVLDHLGAVRQDIGAMKSQLDHGTRRFEAIGDQLDDLEQRQDAAEKSITPLTSSMAKIEPKVKTMEMFLGKKLGPIVAVSSLVVAGALWLIALAIGAAVAWAKANLSDHLHWSEWHVSVVAFACAFLPGFRGERQSPPSPPRTPTVVRPVHDEPDGGS
jgi:hypothetical protein